MRFYKIQFGKKIIKLALLEGLTFQTLNHLFGGYQFCCRILDEGAGLPGPKPYPKSHETT